MYIEPIYKKIIGITKKKSSTTKRKPTQNLLILQKKMDKKMHFFFIGTQKRVKEGSFFLDTSTNCTQKNSFVRYNTMQQMLDKN